jgi:hypothetical protein
MDYQTVNIMASYQQLTGLTAYHCAGKVRLAEQRYQAQKKTKAVGKKSHRPASKPLVL